MIDRYDGDKKKQVNLLAGRINHDIGERTVIGAMGIHKHQADRDVALLSLNGRFGLHRDLTAASQYAVDLVDGEMHWAYHTAMEWIHEGWLGEVQLQEIQDGFRPNEMGLEEEAFRRARARLRYRYEFPASRLVESFWVDTRHFYQTNAQRLLRERLSESRFYIDIGRFNFFTSGGFGRLREVGQLFDTKFIRADIDYQAPWGQLSVLNRFGTRRDEFNRFTSFSGGVNLFGKFTIDLDLENFFWRAYRNTLIFRLRSNYQFTKKIGWRIYVERVDERMVDEVTYNLNSIFDYEFTPESHFFFVVVDSLPGDRAVFAKLAYLFDDRVFRVSLSLIEGNSGFKRLSFCNECVKGILTAWIYWLLRLGPVPRTRANTIKVADAFARRCKAAARLSREINYLPRIGRITLEQVAIVRENQ